MIFDYRDAIFTGELEIGCEVASWFEEYKELAAEEGGELRAYARACFGWQILEIESRDVQKTQLAAVSFIGRTGMFAEELAWRLYDEESGYLIDEASTSNGRFIQIDSDDYRTLEKFERWLFPALEALAASRERAELANASGEGRAAGAARRSL